MFWVLTELSKATHHVTEGGHRASAHPGPAGLSRTGQEAQMARELGDQKPGHFQHVLSAAPQPARQQRYVSLGSGDWTFKDLLTRNKTHSSRLWFGQTALP